MKENVYIEFYGEQILQADVIAEAKKIWKDSGKKAADLKKLEVYIKPEDDRIYYVFNGIVCVAIKVSLQITDSRRLYSKKGILIYNSLVYRRRFYSN